MSHESVIAALNGLSKTRVYTVEMSEHIEHIFRESDRSVIILTGSALEHVLTAVLESRMPSLNGDERARLFGVDGPLGSFANKIRIAQGLGIVDRAMAKRLDLYRAMRNAAAHCVTPISFADAEFHDAIVQLISVKSRSLVEDLTGYGARILFSHLQTIISKSIGLTGVSYDEEETLEFIRELVAMQDEHEQQQSSPDTPGE